jgi:hypothetical protein
MLRIRTEALREAWNDVSPLVRARKQGETLSQHFDTLLSQAAAAETPSQITPLLPELNRNLEQIETLFQPSAQTPNESGNQDDN